MNILEIYNGIKDGSITIELKGHCVNSIEGRIEDEISHINKMIAKYTEGKGEFKEGKRDMLSHYTRRLEETVEHGDYFGVTGMEAQCFDCGCRMYILLQDDKTVTLVPTPAYWDLREKGGLREKISKYDYQIKSEEIPSCEAVPIRKKKKLVSKIDVPSGELIFKNFFKTEKLYEDPANKYGHPDICSVLGRNVLMQYLAKQNVGYGQMGNMSVAIYLKKDGKEIIVSKTYGYDNVKNEEYTVEFKGYSYLGKISLEVWRWQCADKEMLIANNEPIPELEKDKDHYADAIRAKVKRGRWKIEHYFDFFTQKDDEKRNPIYSRLKLME